MMFTHKCLYALLMSSLVFADSLTDFFSLLSPEKNDLLKTFIEIEEFRNITLIGSENVYEENGKLVEIRTIELHWPKYTFWLENSLKNLTAFYSSTSNIHYREYDENENLTAETFAGDNVKFVITDGHKLLEKSITLESVDLVEQAIKQLEITDGNLSILKYDENGQFINDGSKIIPEYLVSVEGDEGETNQNLFDAVIKGFATIFLEENGNEHVIPIKLVQYLEGQFGNREFYAFSGEPSGWYLSDKGFFKITVRFDVGSITYTVCGHRKY